MVCIVKNRGTNIEQCRTIEFEVFIHKKYVIKFILKNHTYFVTITATVIH